MALRVLIVSPDAGFGGLIQQTLDNTGDYEPVLVVNGRQALELASKLPFDLAILDADMTGFTLVELGMALQVLSPQVRLILIPSADSTREIADTGLRVCGYLTKPFYLPDLIEVVTKALHSSSGEQTVGAMGASKDEAGALREIPWTMPGAAVSSPNLDEENPLWRGNVNRAAQHLARLTMASASQAALILRDGQLWAYAGHLSQTAAQELAHIVQRDWLRNPGRAFAENTSSDLARFVRLRVTGDDYMLYATSLGKNMVLVQAFDVRTPISKIHAQAGELARALAASPDADLPEGDTGRVLQGSDPIEASGVSIGKAGDANRKTQEFESEVEELPPIPQLPLEDVPPPNPPAYKGELPQFDAMRWPWELDPELEEGEIEDTEISRHPPRETPTKSHLRESAPKAGGGPAPAEASENVGAEGILWTTRKSQAGEGTTYTEAERLPSATRMILSSAVVYVIHYACVLLPRMPEHLLRGDLAALLSGWMRRISLIEGWRLEYIDAGPGYLHWIAGVAPEVSASEVVAIVRRRTSEWIFSECPSYARENPSNDFWAPGYLVVTGSRPLPDELVNEYIQQTRIRQGVAGE